MNVKLSLNNMKEEGSIDNLKFLRKCIRAIPLFSSLTLEFKVCE